VKSSPEITLPTLEGETPKAYQARVRYLMLGERRTLDAVAQELSKSRSLIARWSERYGWYELAQQYDQSMAGLAARRAAQAYLDDLEAHRERTKRVAGDLYTVAAGLLAQCSRAIKGQTIEGRDGKTYTIPKMELTPASLATATRGLMAALELEAHALDLDKLLPSLTEGGDDA
jgi:hypothetical protein